jgi:hypothetical protein
VKKICPFHTIEKSVPKSREIANRPQIMKRKTMSPCEIPLSYLLTEEPKSSN